MELISYNGHTFRRVPKSVARVVFDNGDNVYLLPNKVRFDNAWIKPYRFDYTNELSFDSAVNAYIYYNCNRETGLSCAYFIMID